MELVARDLKAMGEYVSRNISYNDGTEKGTVQYRRLEHKLTGEQRAAYDRMAEAYQVVLNNFNAALDITGIKGQNRGFAQSAFWSSHQRFFNTVITSMQTPSVIRSIEQDLKDGRSAVIQLTNTGEASQNRELAKRKESGGSLEDFSTAPLDELKGLVEKSFPVQQHEEFIDEDGNTKSRPVEDSNGNAVLNSQAVAMRDRLLEDLESLRQFIPESPLDMLLNHFGVDEVAEVTGRSRRVVNLEDPETGRLKKTEQRTGPAFRKTEVNKFRSSKKRILIFSAAGGTGFSYHAEIGSGNEQQRSHYLLQAG